jgi:hypothetical protein
MCSRIHPASGEDYPVYKQQRAKSAEEVDPPDLRIPIAVAVTEELAKVKTTVSAQGEATASYEQAAVIFDKMSLTPDYPEFLTLPLYEAME